jgi:hypothetical protein
MKLPIYPKTEEFNSVCPEKLKKKINLLKLSLECCVEAETNTYNILPEDQEAACDQDFH